MNLRPLGYEPNILLEVMHTSSVRTCHHRSSEAILSPRRSVRAAQIRAGLLDQILTTALREGVPVSSVLKRTRANGPRYTAIY